SIKEVQKLLGMITFIREFIPDFSRIAEPITRLLRSKEKKFTWTQEQTNAWTEILKRINLKITLGHPRKDTPFILRTDASKLGIGGILLQLQNKKEVIINLFSKRFTETEARWSTYEQEAFAVVYGITKNANLLLGNKFKVETDHRNLMKAFTSDVPKMLRWRIQLSAYSFNISYIPGKENIFADYLSRLQDIQTIATIDSETMTEKIWKTHKKLGHASADTIISELEKHQPVNKETKKLAKELIQSCTQCQKVAPFRGTKTTGHLIASSTFDCISVDTIGEMDEDKLGNRYIIV
ncbi:hypothetical protein ADUPG1_001479, partial [Aduncisulcus paluster]